MDTKKFNLIVKFKADEISLVDNGKIYFKNPEKIINTANFILSFHYKSAIAPIEDGERSKENTIDFSQYKGLLYLEEASQMSFNDVQQLSSQLETLDIVEYTQIEPLEPIIPPTDMQKEVYLQLDVKNTPDFMGYQTYRHGYNGNFTGIDINYLWSLGITGSGVRVADIEWGFNYNHIDLKQDKFIELLATTKHDHDEHGTAVVGVLAAIHNNFGMIGMVYGVDAIYGVSEIPYGRIYGISIGLQRLRAGDVFLYEMQTGGRNGNALVPPDYDKAVWDLTKTATDAGIIIVSAAGNGGENLDDLFYASYRNRGDNGIIRVGAGTQVGQHRAEFSTYGSLVHLQGWGDWSVASTGYGYLFNGGPFNNYTKTFSGTSSATPIVASAVIGIQSWFKTRTGGKVLSPREMRETLIRTGTPQGSGNGGGHIGPLPNVKKAIAYLSTKYNITP